MVEFNGGPAPSMEQVGDYEIWTPNGFVTADIQPGETIENKLIDHRGGGCISFRADGNPSGWTLRNIGVLGQAPSLHGGGSHRFLFRISGDGVFENVFATGWGTQMGGPWFQASHRGTITFRNCYFAGFGNNSIYGSNHAEHDPSHGRIVVEDCVSNSSSTGNFRIGTRGHERSVVRRSLVILNDPDCRRGAYTNGDYNMRGIVARWGEGEARDCSIYMGEDACPDRNHGYQGWHDATLYVDTATCHVVDRGSQNLPVSEQGGGAVRDLNGNRITVDDLGSNPTGDQVSNGGVPLTAEMAARGERMAPGPHGDLEYNWPSDLEEGSGGGGTPEPSPDTSTIEITNDGSERTDYEIVIGGDGEITSTGGFGSGDEITDDGTRATGFVRGGADTITYTGCVQSFAYDGPKPTVFRDGQEVNADNVADCPDDPNGGNGGNGDRAVQVAGALAIGGSILKILRDR